jgi:hypothetical protein
MPLAGSEHLLAVPPALRDHRTSTTGRLSEEEASRHWQRAVPAGPPGGRFWVPASRGCSGSARADGGPGGPVRHLPGRTPLTETGAQGGRAPVSGAPAGKLVAALILLLLYRSPDGDRSPEREDLVFTKSLKTRWIKPPRLLVYSTVPVLLSALGASSSPSIRPSTSLSPPWRRPSRWGHRHPVGHHLLCPDLCHHLVRGGL